MANPQSDLDHNPSTQRKLRSQVSSLEATSQSAVIAPIDLISDGVANMQNGHNVGPPTQEKRKHQDSDPQVTPQSTIAVPSIPTTEKAVSLPSNTNGGPLTKGKRKNYVSSPVNATKSGAKRAHKSIPVMVTNHPYAPTAPKATGSITTEEVKNPSNVSTGGMGQ